MTADDLDFLGLERGPDGRSSFVVAEHLTRIDGKLYGGTGLAVAVAAMEAETGRDCLWATVQFVASAGGGERVECRTEVLAAGRKVSQCRVTATTADGVAFVALGATAVARTNGLDAQFGTPPDVDGPDAAPEFAPRLPVPMPDGPRGFFAACDFRLAVGGEPGGLRIWARVRDRAMTRALLGFVADMVPMGVAQGAGRAGGGLSLDNSIRFGGPPDTDWVLVDLEPHLATGGYGHGLGRLWTPDGRLLGVASQTASMLLFD